MRHLMALAWLSLFVSQAHTQTIPDQVADRWESVGRPVFSGNSRYLACPIRAYNGSSKVVLKDLSLGSVATVQGADPAFGPGSDVMTVVTSSGVSVRNLASGEVVDLSGVTKSALVGEETVVGWGQRRAQIFRLGSEAVAQVDGVDDVYVALKKPLAAFVSNSTTGYVIRVFDAESGTFRVVDGGRGKASSMSWSRDANTLVATVSSGGRSSLVAIDGLSGSTLTRTVLDQVSVAVSGAVRVSPDGQKVAFAVNPVSKPMGVEIWNSRSAVTPPELRVADAHGKACLWNVGSGSVVPVASSVLETVTWDEDLSRALVLDPRPFQTPATRDTDRSNLSVFSSRDGSRRLVFRGVVGEPVPSPDWRRVAVFDGVDWWSVDLAGSKPINMTRRTGKAFSDLDYALPTRVKTAAWQAVWVGSDEILVGDGRGAWRYGCRQDRLMKIAGALTGALRVVPVRGFTTWPMPVEVFDEDTKRAGYSLLGRDGTLKVLCFGDLSVRELVRSPNGKQIATIRADAKHSANVYCSGSQVTQTNPRQTKYAWGKSVLVRYRGPGGRPLQGVLVYPAAYVRGRNYPLVVHVYEKQSDLLNAYLPPNRSGPYSPRMLSNAGYFVLLPDIEYSAQAQPGQDALRCVESALDRLKAMKVGVDSNRVGIIGYSWGGYEAAYLSTVSRRFAVAVCGSGLTDFASFSLLHHWKSGMPLTELVEHMQPRMNASLWQAPEKYRRSSTIWRANERKTPLLIQVGDQDDVVDWHQGLSLFNALRRLGKPAILLNYRGEKHGTMSAANQLDYAKRLRHYLDVYLRGVKPEAWVASVNAP